MTQVKDDRHAPPDHDPEPDLIEVQPRRTLLRRISHWLEHAQALKGWIAEARKRSRALDATFETIEHDSDIGGGMLAGALSYRLFVFLLPLAFFIVSGIGLLGDAIGKDPRLIANSVGFASVVTGEVASTAKSTSNWWVALTSFFALVYATRVLCRAVAIVHSLAWERTASSVKVTSHMLTVFASVVLGQIVFAAGVGAVGHQTVVGGIFVALLGAFVVAVLWLVVSLNLPHSSARWTDLIPGSVWYGVGLLCIQGFNVLVLGSLLQSKSTTYGALGIAGTLLLGLFFVGRVIVGAAVLNATLYRRAEPRRRNPDRSPG